MATSLASLLGQNIYTNSYKSSASWYKSQMSDQMFGQQDLAARNNMMLQNVLEKNAAMYDKNMAAISDYNANSKPFFNEFNSKLGSLKNSSEALKSYGSSSVLNPTGYGSSDNKVVAVKSGNVYGAKDMDIKVQQIATGQTSKTNELDSKSVGTLSGPASINITNSDGKSTKLNFNLNPTMSAGDAMKEIAKTVNNSNAGITASIVEKDGKSSLAFTSTATGTDATFKMEMTGKLKGALDPKVTTEGQDAKYSVNGTEYKSKTNDVKIGTENVSVTLKGAGDAKLSKSEIDNSKVVDAIKTFANDLNNAVSFLKENSDKSSAVRGLRNSLSSFQYRESSFSQIGLEIKGGKMTVNEEKLTKALQDNPQQVKNLLGGTTGFAAEANKNVSAALQRQTQYMPPPQVASSTGTDFRNNYNPYSGTVFDVFA